MQLTIATATYNGNTVVTLPNGFEPSKTLLVINGQIWTSNNYEVRDGAIVIAEDDLSAAVIQVVQLPDNSTAIDDLTKKINALLQARSTAAYQQVAVPTLTTTPPPQTAALQADLRNLCGMDCNTGKLISGLPYLRQRITDALLTRIGSQCLLRPRGSLLQDKIDQPMNRLNLLLWIADVANALASPLAGVPDFVLSRVHITGATIAGQLGFTLTGKWAGADVEVTV